MALARVVVTIDYEVELKNYPGAKTARDAAVIDVKNLEEANIDLEGLLAIAEMVAFEPGQ